MSDKRSNPVQHGNQFYCHGNHTESGLAACMQDELVYSICLSQIRWVTITHQEVK